MQERYSEDIISIGESKYKIRSVPDVQTLFDHLAGQPDDHPDVADERIPYWAELWPSALGLSQWILENNAIFERRSVLEIGCGLGLPGIVAADFARNVCLTDYMEAPLSWASENWQLNRMETPDVRILDWRAPDESFAADIVLASDVAYERRMFEPLMNAMQKLILPGGFAVLSEPKRLLAKDFLEGFVTNGFNHVFTETKVNWKTLDHRIGIHVLRKKG